MQKNLTLKFLVVLIIIFNITSCTINTFSDEDGPPPGPVDLSQVKEPIPKYEPKSKFGNPESYKVFGKRYFTMDESKGFTQSGLASWYGTKFHGKRTSSGESYDMYAMTGAHKTLPLPTYARVTNTDNNKSVIVKINDRGPFHSDRIIDLSYAAAHKIGLVGKGTAHVKLTAIDPNAHRIKITEHDTKNNPRHNPKLDSRLIVMQIGSFQDKKKALQLTNKASDIFDHPVKLQSVKNKNKNIYRVQLGPFPESNSPVIKDKLATLNIKNPITLSNITNSKITNSKITNSKITNNKNTNSRNTNSRNTKSKQKSTI